MSTRHDRMNQEILEHGKNLNTLFNLNVDPVKLAKQIHSLEIKAHKLATDYCNGENNVTTDNWEALTGAILDKLDKITGFRSKSIPVFVNGDARGYALKINDEWIRANGAKLYTDLGGYGAGHFKSALPEGNDN